MPRRQVWYIHLRERHVDGVVPDDWETFVPREQLRAHDRDRWRPVEGYRVRIPGYEEFDFFVHGDRNSWTVSDARTGCFLVMYQDTQKEAIAAAQKRLDCKAGSPEKYRAVLAAQERRTGLSPRYEEALIDRATFSIKFDPHVELAWEKKQSLFRMGQYGLLRETTDGWLWTPGPSQEDPEKTITREGFIIINKTEGR